MTSPSRSGLSRREFIGASAAIAVMGTGLAVAAPATSAAAPTGQPLTASLGDAVGRWIEREIAGNDGVPRPRSWHCPSNAAALQLRPDGAVHLHEPGWGPRTFAVADFSHGHPQDAVRRLFGDGVLEELQQVIARPCGIWPGSSN